MRPRSSLHSEKQISLEALLNKAGNLTISPDEASTLAGRLARLNNQITPDERAELESLAGRPLHEVIASVSSCADPDSPPAGSRIWRQERRARPSGPGRPPAGREP